MTSIFYPDILDNVNLDKIVEQCKLEGEKLTSAFWTSLYARSSKFTKSRNFIIQQLNNYLRDNL